MAFTQNTHIPHLQDSPIDCDSKQAYESETSHNTYMYIYEKETNFWNQIRCCKITWFVYVIDKLKYATYCGYHLAFIIFVLWAEVWNVFFSDVKNIV